MRRALWAILLTVVALGWGAACYMAGYSDGSDVECYPAFDEPVRRDA